MAVGVASPSAARTRPKQPPGTGPLALPDYGSLRAVHHRWWIAAYSGPLGAASHLALDRFEARLPAAEYVMHIIGISAMLAIGLVAGIVALPAAAATPFLPAAFLAHTTGVRLLCAIGAGLLTAAAAVAASPEPSATHSNVKTLRTRNTRTRGRQLLLRRFSLPK